MTPTETVSRLRRLADDWRKEEKQLCEQFGSEVVPRSMRARRIKDTRALEAAVEMIEHLEAAEKELESWKGLAQQFGNEADALRAKIEAMEKQEPYSYIYEYANPIDGSPVWRDKPGYWNAQFSKSSKPLYLAPGAQPARIEQDTSVRKAWARFSNELHRSHDAPYPGMSDAFEQHFSQSFTDREWRAESSTWAAAWKAAKRHGAQPAPIIPEGWKLVPIEPTQEIRDAWTANMHEAFRVAWRAALEAATEAKP